MIHLYRPANCAPDPYLRPPEGCHRTKILVFYLRWDYTLCVCQYEMVGKTAAPKSSRGKRERETHTHTHTHRERERHTHRERNRERNRERDGKMLTGIRCEL